MPTIVWRMASKSKNIEKVSPKLPSNFKIPLKPSPETADSMSTNGANAENADAEKEYQSPLRYVEVPLENLLSKSHVEVESDIVNKTSPSVNVTPEQLLSFEDTRKRKLAVMKVPEGAKTLPFVSGRSSYFPDKLNEMFQPFICKLCNAKFTSLKIGGPHFESKHHVKKVTAWLNDWCAKTGESMPKIPKLIKEGLTGPESYHCQACDLPLTSLLHANQHYNGKKHKMVAARIAKPTGSGYYDPSGKWIRTPTNIKTDSRYGIGESFNKPVEEKSPTKSEKSEKINPKQRHCDICNIDVTDESQMVMHLQGSKHAKMLKKKDQPPVAQLADTLMASIQCAKKNIDDEDLSIYRTPSGSYYCKNCDLNLPESSQMKQHLGGKRHLKSLKNLTKTDEKIDNGNSNGV